MEALPEHAKLAAEIIGVICVVATVIVRLTPDKKDDEKVGKIAKIIFTIINYLPTLGINPRTKQLEKIVREEGKDKKEEEKN